MAMGLAVTWCDTPRRLMGRAALHQQGPNEVRHRFSPRDHGNVKVPQHAICEKIVTGHHLLSWWRVRTSQASNLLTALGRLRQIRHQYHQSTFCWPWKRHLLFPMSPGHTPKGQHNSDGRHTRGDLVEHGAPGHVSIITGLEAVMHRNTKHVLQGGGLTDDGRQVGKSLHLLTSCCTVMRCNSALTTLFSSILIFLLFYLCLWHPPSFTVVCYSFKTQPRLAQEF